MFLHLAKNRRSASQKSGVQFMIYYFSVLCFSLLFFAPNYNATQILLFFFFSIKTRLKTNYIFILVKQNSNVEWRKKLIQWFWLDIQLGIHFAYKKGVLPIYCSDLVSVSSYVVDWQIYFNPWNGFQSIMNRGPLERLPTLVMPGTSPAWKKMLVRILCTRILTYERVKSKKGLTWCLSQVISCISIFRRVRFLFALRFAISQDVIVARTLTRM